MRDIISVTLKLTDGSNVKIKRNEINNIEFEGIKEGFKIEQFGFLEYKTCEHFSLELLKTANKAYMSAFEGENELIFDLLKRYNILSISLNYTDKFNELRQSPPIFLPLPDNNMADIYKLQEKNINSLGNLLIETGRECQTINIRYTSKELESLDYIEGKSDWIDLRSAESVKLKAGEHKLISLGVAMQIPEGYEAHVVPRSSTLENYGLIQGNHLGVIDQKYSGNTDIWKFSAYALRDTEINFNDRICQFRIVKNQPQIVFNKKDELQGPDRGGFGSTGVK